MSYIYLASPYNHPSPKIMDLRYNVAMDATVWLLKQRKWVYSPIVHCHNIAIRHDLPRDYKFWKEYNQTMLIEAISVYVLDIDGVAGSKGVQDEVLFAAEECKPIFYLTPTADGYVGRPMDYRNNRIWS